MSVIIGCKTNNVVVLGADNRLSTYHNEYVSDDKQKIFVVNNHVAIAFAGNAAIQMAIETEINKVENKERIFVEDILDVIQEFYNRLKELECKVILSYSAYFIIGGLDRYNSLKLISISHLHEELQWSEHDEHALFPPNDLEMGECTKMYFDNYYYNTERFVEDFIEQISYKSKVVSKSGNKWIYDIRSNASVLRKF